jgi:hypothetical protein
MGLQLSGSVQLEGNLLVTGSANSVFENISVTNRITANEINVQFVSSSIIYSSGSNRFGDEAGDVHQFTGSVDVLGTGLFTGDLTSNGELRVSNSTGLTFLQLTNSSVGGRNFTLISSGVSNPHSVAAGNFYLRNSTLGTNPFFIDGSSGAATFSSSVMAGGGSLFNANSGTLTADILTVRGGGSSGAFGFRVEANNGEDIFFVNNTSYNITMCPIAGNVGIGTPSPKSYATLTNAGQLISINNIGIDAGQSFRLNNYYNAGTETDRTISTGFAASIGLDNSVGDIIFSTSPSSVSADTNTSQIEAMRITSARNVSITDGNLVIGTAGKGIDFSATSNGSGTTTSELLNDYEEGTWTPTLPNGGTLTINNARYVKVGQKVTVSFYASSIVPTNDGAEFLIGGLPYANAFSSPALYFGGSFGFVGTGNLNKYLALTGSNFSYIYFHANNGTGAGARLLNSDYFTDRGDGQLIITLTYFTAT